MELWGRFMWWLCQGQHAAAMQTIAAIAQAILTVVAMGVAIFVPWWQQHEIQRREKEARDKEVDMLRLALKREVVMVSGRCHHAYTTAKTYKWLPPKSESFPQLTIFEANASKISWLNSQVLISALIEFSASLADIRYRLSNLTLLPNNHLQPDDQPDLVGMMKDAMGHAETFLRSVGGLETNDEGTLKRLHDTRFEQPT